MVVDIDDSATADRVFAALSDATRRDIVARVLVREASVTSLAAGYAMTFAAVQKHVAVLERAHLVTKTRRGREQLVRGDVEGLRTAVRLLERYEDLWRGRVQRIDDLLAGESPPRPAYEHDPRPTDREDPS